MPQPPNPEKFMSRDNWETLLSRESWTPETETQVQAEARVEYCCKNLLYLLPLEPPGVIVKGQCRAAINALNLLLAAIERTERTEKLPLRTAGSENPDQPRQA
jgi:hypothetical protein